MLNICARAGSRDMKNAWKTEKTITDNFWSFFSACPHILTFFLENPIGYISSHDKDSRQIKHLGW